MPKNMFPEAFYLFCIHAVLIQCVLSQCISPTFSTAPEVTAPYDSTIAAPFLASVIFAYVPAIEVTRTVSGSLPVTSASAVPPEPIIVESKNTYEGTVTIAGELPFVGTLGFDSVLPSAGLGVVSHACGNIPARITSTNFELGRTNSAIANSASAVGLTTPFGYRTGYADHAFSSPRSAGAYSRADSPMNTFSHGLRYFDAIGNEACSAIGIYGGAGEGNAAVIGELPVAGNTAVIGQVPIAGAVGFQGAVPASGAVFISGLCSCGSNAPYLM